LVRGDDRRAGGAIRERDVRHLGTAHQHEERGRRRPRHCAGHNTGRRHGKHRAGNEASRKTQIGKQHAAGERDRERLGSFDYDAPRRWGRELDDHAHGLLKRVGLPNAAHAGVSALTYIDQKRVELARALASDPKILLLDEWLAGLNPTELKMGIALIEQLRNEGCTIIIVEHVMHAIRSLCDRCIVMNSGAKIAEGTPAEVLADHGVIRAYLGDENA